MDVCERVSHHEPSSPAWRDKFFAECATALMDPRAAVAVGSQAWLPRFLRCITTRLDNDVPPLLPGREAVAALQCLAAVSRGAAARPSVKQAIMGLGPRADELFHDRLQGLRSLDDVVEAESTASGPITGKSLVHNAFVVCLMRCENYQLSASALLELVDHDTAALISILLAVAKITTYELGVTANCLACIFALTTPATYFSAETAQGAEVSLSSFTSKLNVLLREWSAANVLDTVLPLLHRRCQLWATNARGGASPANSAAFSTAEERADEPAQIADCVASLGRSLLNLSTYIADPRATTAVRQHVLVVQNAARPFTGILSALAAVIVAPGVSTVSQLQGVDALASALNMFNVASRDVIRVPQPLREGLVACLKEVWSCPAVLASDDPACLRLLFASAVALTNAQCILEASSLAEGCDDAERWSGEVTERIASRLGTVAPPSGRPWVALLAAQPLLNHAKFELAFPIFEAYVGSDLDAALKDLDGQAEAIEREMKVLETARSDLQLHRLEARQQQLENQQMNESTEVRQGGELDSPPKAQVQSSATTSGPSLLGDLPALASGKPRRTSSGEGSGASSRREANGGKARKLLAVTTVAKQAPPELLCALYGNLMSHPVKLPCGRYVEKAALEEVIHEMGHVDPVSLKPLPNDFEMAVDAAMKNRIVEYRFQSEITQARAAAA